VQSKAERERARYRTSGRPGKRECNDDTQGAKDIDALLLSVPATKRCGSGHTKVGDFATEELMAKREKPAGT
jgi:hypothetical protein